MRPTLSLHARCLLGFACLVIHFTYHSADSSRCFGLTDPILYVDDSAGRLGTINLRTHETTVVGSLGVVLADIAFSPTGHLFGVSPDGLWQVDSATAASQYIGGVGFFGVLMNALVFDTDGKLYAAAANTTFLYEVNPATGETIPVADMGVWSTGDLVFDDARKLYLSGNDSNLYVIDRGTGLGTWIGSFGFPDVLGLASDSGGEVYGYSGTSIFTVDLNTGSGSLLLNYGSSGLTEAYGGSLRYEVVPSGDFDLDEDVDGYDFLLWQQTYGSITELAADGNGNGIVDAGDLSLWHAQFGLNESSTALVTAVPEPSSRGSVVCLFLSLVLLRRGGESWQNQLCR